jgi:hypothetical protein
MYAGRPWLHVEQHGREPLSSNNCDGRDKAKEFLRLEALLVPSDPSPLNAYAYSADAYGD